MAYRFIPQPGTDWTKGDLPEIVKRLNMLAQNKKQNIYGISGYRTPAHSVEVGGFANDPHTKGLAGDIGLGSPSRASAAKITDTDLGQVGLKRPFPGAAEINHVQLVKSHTSVGSIAGAVAKSPVDTASKAAGAATDAASDVGKAVVGSITDQLGEFGARVLVYAVLIFGGAALAFYGILRLTGQTDAPANAVKQGLQAANLEPPPGLSDAMGGAPPIGGAPAPAGGAKPGSGGKPGGAAKAPAKAGKAGGAAKAGGTGSKAVQVAKVIPK
jgi:hypothetical protein